jgi:hypothetical protein
MDRVVPFNFGIEFTAGNLVLPLWLDGLAFVDPRQSLPEHLLRDLIVIPFL